MQRQRTDYDYQEVESEKNPSQPPLADKVAEINVEEIEMSPNSRNTAMARKFRTLASAEYPVSNEYRSNSVAITRITEKRKAERAKNESLINIKT